MFRPVAVTQSLAFVQLYLYFCGLGNGQAIFQTIQFLAWLSWGCASAIPTSNPFPVFSRVLCPYLSGLFPRVVFSTFMVATFASYCACFIVLLHLGSICTWQKDFPRHRFPLPLLISRTCQGDCKKPSLPT